METPNTASLGAEWQRIGVSKPALRRAYRGVNAFADAFRKAGDADGA